MKRRNPLADIVLVSLLSAYLLAALVAVGPAMPPSLADALRWGGSTSLPVGPVGEVLGRTLTWLLGPWLRWPVAGLPLAILWLRHRKVAAPRRRLVEIVAGITVWLGILAHDAWFRVGFPDAAGGALGNLVEGMTRALVGSLGSFLLLASVGAFLILRHLPPLHFDLPALDPVLGWLSEATASLVEGIRSLPSAVASRARAWRAAFQTTPVAPGEEAPEEAPVVVSEEDDNPLRRRELRVVGGPAGAETPEEVADLADDEEWEYEDEAVDEGDEEYEDEYDYEDEDDPDPVEAAGEDVEAAVASGGEDFRLSRDPRELIRRAETPAPKRRRRRGKLPLPSLDLLEDVPKEERGFTPDVLQMKARQLMETLSNYGIEGRINEIRPGPVVTTFEFEPAPGVKVSQINSRQDDLALAMRATRIRIEAPIPGKAAVGIEIPNPYPQMVTLKEVIGAIADDDPPLQMALGKDTEGSPHIADISEMPHLLVAGATGSGKSVCINAIICNLLLRNGPDRLRLLMVDPKMLELSVYNGIPHLMHPVITEAREALKAVKWAVAEMSVRYHKLAKHGVRNIADFNKKIEAGQVKDAEGNKVKDAMPYFVIIIDELADLMMQLGQDLETPIARLAQMARAVGIHLVLATQRPSVNVITGVIKANFPSRIAFRVMSKIDSRTILDGQGAEQLLGKGDMLFLLAGSPQPVRVHGAYLDIEECERIVEHWREYTEEDAHLDLEVAGEGGGVDLGEDELLDEAKRMVVMTQTGSTSMLQRRLRVGYTRAARLMDMLEANGVVGPYEGSKAREVLVSKDQLEAEG